MPNQVFHQRLACLCGDCSLYCVRSLWLAAAEATKRWVGPNFRSRTSWQLYSCVDDQCSWTTGGSYRKYMGNAAIGVKFGANIFPPSVAQINQTSTHIFKNSPFIPVIHSTEHSQGWTHEKNMQHKNTSEGKCRLQWGHVGVTWLSACCS